MENINWKIIYLLKSLYELKEDDEKKILEILEKMTEEEKIEIAYILKKRLDYINTMLNQAMWKLKTMDYEIEDIKVRQWADKWLEEILEQIK